MSYSAFVAGKLARHVPTGIADPCVDGYDLFDFQRALVTWALRRGRAAIFADTGLGKSRQQIAWASEVAKHTGRQVLILAPLAVGAQTEEEARAIGVDAKHVKEPFDGSKVIITNYERLHHFDATSFGGVVLDESSIIKHHTSKTLQLMMDAFADTQFKLCCTATPAPNDFMELGTHAEFLGVCTRAEMLSEYFVHDGGETQKWRLKGHARDGFWRFVASWGALVRSPADLGFDGSRYDLPPMSVENHTVSVDHEEVRGAGMLFAMQAQTLTERRNARRASTESRVRACANMVNADAEPWVVWCDLNVESQSLTNAIDGAIEVTGSMSTDEKEAALMRFARGDARVIVSKPSICGFGLNWQHCARMAFVGVTDSWESYYQAVRRIHRFGQKRECEVHVFASELEGNVVANLQRKERDSIAMAEALSSETSAVVMESVTGSVRATNTYGAGTAMVVPAWCSGEA